MCGYILTTFTTIRKDKGTVHKLHTSKLQRFVVNTEFSCFTVDKYRGQAVKYILFSLKSITRPPLSHAVPCPHVSSWHQFLTSLRRVLCCCCKSVRTTTSYSLSRLPAISPQHCSPSFAWNWSSHQLGWRDVPPVSTAPSLSLGLTLFCLSFTFKSNIWPGYVRHRRTTTENSREIEMSEYQNILFLVRLFETIK